MTENRASRWLHKIEKLAETAKWLCQTEKWWGAPMKSVEPEKGAETGATAFSPEQAYLRSLVETVRKKTEQHQRAIQKVQGQTWVTAEGVRSSTIASIWVIKRFIDPGALVKLVPPSRYQTAPGELSFGMAHADYPDTREKCTFELLVESFNLSGSALTALSEVIHDITTGEGRFRNHNARRLKTLLTGIILIHDRDAKRLERSFAILDEFYNHYAIKNP